MNNEKDKAYYKIEPTGMSGFNQELLLIEQSKKPYGFASCPRDRNFFCVSEDDVQRLYDHMEGNDFFESEISTDNSRDKVSKLINFCSDSKVDISPFVIDVINSFGFKK